MSRLIAIIVLSLAGGFAAAFWFTGAGDERTATRASGESMAGNSGFDARPGVLERLRVLESAIGVEREARQLLEEELIALYEALEGRDRPEEMTAPDADLREPAAASNFQSRRRAASGDDRSGRLQALTDAGFPPERAEWITERESELRLQAMQDRFKAMRENFAEFGDEVFGQNNSLRDDIGDDEYAMYLEANRRPTTIDVRSVLDRSPAVTAGLQPGDQISYYDGVRVFDIGDLTRQTMRGEPGESVVVTVVRDGAPMQVVMPRGPLGIMSRRGR